MTRPTDRVAKQPPTTGSYVLNDKGEEIPITEEMVEQSLNEIKLQSLGVHTGFNKIITDDMLAGADKG